MDGRGMEWKPYLRREIDDIAIDDNGIDDGRVGVEIVGVLQICRSLMHIRVGTHPSRRSWNP